MATPSTTAPEPTGLDRFAVRICESLASLLDQPLENLILERPRQESLGEFALPCFRFVEKGGNPAALAKRLAKEMEVDSVQANAVGPFLNFRVDASALAGAILADAPSPHYGGGHRTGTILVEFSSPNIAKPMHVGHLRSTLIGATLARLGDLLGHNVIRINHLGDWGSQFGKLVAGWNLWGDETKLEANPIGHLLDIYVRFHKEEKELGLAAAAKKAFQELESGENNATRMLWQRFTELSLGEFQKTYDRLGTSFDFVRGESWYENQLEPLLSWLEEAGILETSEGATIINLESQGLDVPCLVRTAHGTTLYATRDLAAARSRWQEFQFDAALYVVGSEQNLHFRQFPAALKLAGCDWADRIEHVPFGLIRLLEGTLSTREGRVLTLAEVLDRAVDLAGNIIQEKNPELANRDAVAEQVGIGAVVFHDLKHQRQKEVVFDWKEVLSFEGDTGPYLQYTHARCCSILRKANRPAPDTAGINPELLADSRELMVAIGRFPQVVRETFDKREPALLAQYLLRLAGVANGFYRDRRVLGAGKGLEDARLCAMDLIRRTLNSGLGLLGVPSPEEM